MFRLAAQFKWLVLSWPVIESYNPASSCPAAKNEATQQTLIRDGDDLVGHAFLQVQQHTGSMQTAVDALGGTASAAARQQPTTTTTSNSSNTTKSSTLFRGGRCSRAVSKVVDHAINPRNINRMTVHMLVANARLGHGVCVDSFYLDRHLSDDGRWSCVSMPQHEEMAYVKGLRLTEFQPELVSGMGIVAPDGVVVSISKNGSVNFFVTMASNVEFERDIERKYAPFLVELLEVISAGS